MAHQLRYIVWPIAKRWHVDGDHRQAEVEVLTERPVFHARSEITVEVQQPGLPQHGLDTSLGQVALYSSVPAWHELGNIIPGGTADVEQVLTLGGIDFEVLRRPVEYRNRVDGPGLILADHALMQGRFHAHEFRAFAFQ